MIYVADVKCIAAHEENGIRHWIIVVLTREVHLFALKSHVAPDWGFIARPAGGHAATFNIQATTGCVQSLVAQVNRHIDGSRAGTGLFKHFFGLGHIKIVLDLGWCSPFKKFFGRSSGTDFLRAIFFISLGVSGCEIVELGLLFLHVQSPSIR